MSDVSKTNERTTDPRLTGGYQLGVHDIPALVAQIDQLERVAAQLKQRDEDTMRLFHRAEAERDAALAAVERVRAAAKDWECDEDAKGLHFDLVAALDGAPEPEVKP